MAPTAADQHRAHVERACTEARDLSEHGLPDDPGVPWDAAQRVSSLYAAACGLCADYAAFPAVRGVDSEGRQELLDVARDCLAIAASESLRGRWLGTPTSGGAREELEEAARSYSRFLRVTQPAAEDIAEAA